MNENEKRQLDEQGYLVLEGFMGDALLDAVRRRVEELFAEEGERAGSEFKQEPQTRRLANLVDGGPLFEGVIAIPRFLGCVSHVLGPVLRLRSLNARSANPYSDCIQPLHRDAGAIPDAHGFLVCNTI